MSAPIKVKPEEITILPPEVEEKVTNEILVIRSEANVTEELIKSLKDEYGGLTIKDQSDKEGYLNAQTARKVVKKVRVAAEKLFDKGREEAVAVANKWLESKKSVVAALKEIEDPLSDMEEAWEKEDQRIKLERKAKIEQQGIVRMKDMITFGAQLQGSNWVLGEVSYEAALVKEADDDIYQTMYGDFKAIFDEKEKDRLALEEKDRNDKAELLRQQEALKQQQKEAKDMRTQGRISFLQSLGLTKEGSDYVYDRIRVSLTNIEERDSERWDNGILDINAIIADIKNKESEKKEKEKLFQSRLAKLKGWVYNGFTVSRPSDAEGGMNTYGSVDDLLALQEILFEELVRVNEKNITELEDKKEKKRLKDLKDAADRATGVSRGKMLLAVEGIVGGDPIVLGQLSDEEWNTALSGATNIYNKKQKDKADKVEEDRKELLGEKQRYEELIAAIRNVSIPEFKSGQYRAKINVIRNFIEGLK